MNRPNYYTILLTTIVIFVASFFIYTKFVRIKKTSRFQAIIFDMDGTTLATDHLWKIANAPILDSHAPHLDDQEKANIIKKFDHISIYDVWKLVGDACSIPLTEDQLIEENIFHLHKLYQKEGIEFIENFPQFHQQVISYGLKTAIASNSQLPTMNVITQIVPLQNYFKQHIYTADHVGKVFKPAPDIYLYAAKMLQVEPCNCIAIEDSSSGIKSAKAAGMYCIGINTGKNRKALEQADQIVDGYDQINLEQLLYTIQ